MNFATLEAKIHRYNPRGDLGLVEKAYEVALAAHAEQRRVSGEPYIDHPLAVAGCLADLELDLPTLAAGLLHDVVEDSSYTLEEIREGFGEEVAGMVDGVTKLSRIEHLSREEMQAENLRKMVLAMAKDVRVILIKLADRLHNLKTLKYLPEKKRVEIARESLEIFAPLAHRLGIFRLKGEMEDLALYHLEPEKYKEVAEKVSRKRREREEYINNLVAVLQEKLVAVGIAADIQGRPKNFYSIYKKMYTQNKDFSQIYDLVAIRVIVDNVKDCYGALGIVHALWKPIPGRFKDYLAMPKSNMYQSLHTTVIGPTGEPFEIQIRTWEMHRTAEYGIAAHWRYKEGTPTDRAMDEKLAWLRQVMDWQHDLRDAKDFVETLKIDLFDDEVFVFTPKGQVIDLPTGATPIDFAYRIHTDVGHHCAGAKVNGKIVPLDYRLKSGDITEILTNKNSAGPSRGWLALAVTSGAKNRIRQWFKTKNREENLARGRDSLEKESRRQGFDAAELLRPEWLEVARRRYNLGTTDDLLATVGYGGLSTVQVISRLREEYRKEKKVAAETGGAVAGTSGGAGGPGSAGSPGALNAAGAAGVAGAAGAEAAERVWQGYGKAVNGVRVKGIDNVLVRFSRCCLPVPGDRIIGYVTRGRGVSIHRWDCPNSKELLAEPGRLIEVAWDRAEETQRPVEIRVQANDRAGLLADVAGAVAEKGVNILTARVRVDKKRTALVDVTMEIASLRELEGIMERICALPGVVKAERVAREKVH